jgi:hypothetical protein
VVTVMSSSAALLGAGLLCTFTTDLPAPPCATASDDSDIEQHRVKNGDLHATFSIPPTSYRFSPVNR